jgi:hypothetical protein
MEGTAIKDSLFEVVKGSNFDGGPAGFPVIVIGSHGIKGLDANRIIRDELAADYCCTE